MKNMKKFLLLSVICGLIMLPLTALADSITPASISTTLNVGQSYNVTKRVTVSKVPPTSAPVDVFFLADSTGSMGGQIGALKTGVAGIVSATSTLGDVQYGVGEYKDFTTIDPHAYLLNQAMTSNTGLVTTAVDTWSVLPPGSGVDWPEAQMYALEQVATSTATGWRTGSTRILVWFGDAPGHDPSGGSTEAYATAALVANNISVEAVDCSQLDAGDSSQTPPIVAGQASRIAAATGGTYHPSVSTDALVTTITNAITTSMTTYSSVVLDLSEAPTGLTVVTPDSYAGSWIRDADRDFDFALKITADAPGSYSFNIYGLVDGGRVATEHDAIRVPGSGPAAVPEPSTILLLCLGLLGMVGLTAKRR